MRRREQGGWVNHGPSSSTLVIWRSPRWWWERYGRTGGFRGHRLNLAGWSALLGTGAVLGLALAWAGGASFPLVGVPLGMIGSWLAALVFDTWSWWQADCGYEVTELDPEVLDALVAGLRAGGIPVAVDTWPEDRGDRRSLRAPNRHSARVTAALEAAGWGQPGPGPGGEWRSPESHDE